MSPYPTVVIVVKAQYMDAMYLAQGVGFKVQGSGFRVESLGFRV